MPPEATASDFDMEEFLAVYRAAPERFVTDILGAEPWEKQVEIIQSVFKNKITAVKTCNAVGKSFIAARIVIAYLCLFPGSIVVTTAPTWRQVTDVLWREIATAVKHAKYQLTSKEVKQAGLDFDKDWYAVGLSTKYPENFFGYHADDILVVVDEAGGVEEPIFKGVAAITPNVKARILLIGNPTSPGGTFHDMFTKKELGAKCFTISAFDTPNFMQVGIRNLEDLLRVFTPPPGVEQVDHKPFPDDFKWANSKLISPQVVYGRYHEWGTDNQNWEALVMGEFPSQSDQALIPTDLATKARNMGGKGKYFNPTTQQWERTTNAEISGWNIPAGGLEIGLDMARFGLDKTVLTPRRGGWVDEQISWGKTDLVMSADKVLSFIDPYAETPIKIDDTGNGGGTTDVLVRYRDQQYRSNMPAYNYQIIPYNMASSPRNKEKFADLTSEMYWNLREWFMNKAIAIPDDQQLFDELIARRWSMTKDGKIKVESKDDYKKRTGGKSPDKSDSLALAFATSISYNSVQEIDNQRAMETAGQQVAPGTYQPVLEPLTGGLAGRRY